MAAVATPRAAKHQLIAKLNQLVDVKSQLVAVKHLQRMKIQPAVANLLLDVILDVIQRHPSAVDCFRSSSQR